MFKTISVCVLILSAFVFTTMAQTAATNWEYLVVYENGNISLNDLGQKGWELAEVKEDSIRNQFEHIESF
jgi:hypothetical protein